MNREELEEMLENYIPGCSGDWKESILEVIVSVYNKAIEDAIDSLDSDMCFAEESSHCTQDEIAEGILKLKIK
jgi:hypothetical protein